MNNKTHNNMTQQPKLILHGEAMVFQSTIPDNATPLFVEEKLIVADSEITGNHHVIDKEEGVEFFQLGNRRFMRNTKPAKIRCVHSSRHDEIVLKPDQWEFGTQQEF